MKVKRNIKILLILFLVIISILGYYYSKNESNNLAKSQKIEMAELPKAYTEWLKLLEEGKEGILKPRSFSVSVEKNEEVKEKIMTGEGETYPAQYDLRTYNTVKGVKNQRSWGFCWAFAGTSSLESHLLNETRNDIYSNATDIGYNLNPMHVGYSLAYSFSYNIANLYGNRELGDGGNNIDNALYWASGIGPVSTDNFTTTSEALPIHKGANEILVQTEDVQVENSLFFPTIDISTATEAEKTNYINLMKSEILENGAISFASMAPVPGMPGYNSTTETVYTETQDEVNAAPHMMLIVGWDDTFSKNNFNVGVVSGQKPSIDGAWIVQNSWGEDVGINGYCYYSYEDYGLTNNDMFVVGETSTKDYDNIYQYNPSGDVAQCSGQYAANVFKKSDTGTENLTEVSFFNFYPNTEYQIYVNAVDGSLTGDNVQYVQTYTDTNSFSEYITIQLDNPIELTGQYFSVILKVNNNQETYNIAAQINSHNALLDEDVNIKPGQSFASNDGETWTDLGSEENVTILIKAFTTNSNENTDVTINSSLNTNEIYLKGVEEGLLVTNLTKNIANANNLTYEIKNSENIDVTNQFTITKSQNDNIHYANIVIPANYDLIGDYTLNIKYDGVTKSTCSFSINRQLITSINALKEKIYLQVGDTNKLAPKVSVEPETILNPYIEYESQNTSIATISTEGVVTATGLGTTNIEINALDGSNISKIIPIIVVDLADELEGTGTEIDPYIISSVDDLNLVRADLTACYKLNNEIDLSLATAEGGTYYNNGLGFEPIGFLQIEEDVIEEQPVRCFYRKLGYF